VRARGDIQVGRNSNRCERTDEIRIGDLLRVTAELLPGMAGDKAERKLMSLLAIWLLLLTYPLLSTWAASIGRRQLWSAAIATGALVVVGALVLGRIYSVPDPTRVVLSAVLLLGPSIAIPSIALGVADPDGGSFSSRIGRAFLGTLFGFALGWVAVVFGLGVW